MKLTIRFLRPFSDVVGKGELRLDFEGRTLKDLLEELARRYPGLKKELYSADGALSVYVSVFVNDKSADSLQGLRTRLKDCDELLVFVPISGG